jgi:hypothetical protein
MVIYAVERALRWHHEGMSQPSDEWITLMSYENRAGNPHSMAAVRA